MGAQSSQQSTVESEVCQPKPSMNNMFHEKSNEVNPGQDFYLKGKTTANDIFNILRRNRKDVDRVIIAGSIGKRTAVGDGPDFDVVIFLNNQRPPFGSVVREIKQTLENNSHELKNYKFEYIPRSDMFISFKVSGFKFDLSPATNFQLRNGSQYYGTREAIDSLPDPVANGFLYSPGFAESSVEFLKEQNQFVHSVIRLAKYWNSNVAITTGSYIRGRSLLMELISIKSCEEVGGTNLHLAFKRFLENITNFPHLKIIFERYYKKNQIHREILQYNGPIIMDPVNYYNNMAKDDAFPISAVSIFIKAANISLQRLDEWQSDPNARAISFHKVFEPQS